MKGRGAIGEIPERLQSGNWDVKRLGGGYWRLEMRLGLGYGNAYGVESGPECWGAEHAHVHIPQFPMDGAIVHVPEADPLAAAAPRMALGRSLAGVAVVVAVAGLAGLGLRGAAPSYAQSVPQEATARRLAPPVRASFGALPTGPGRRGALGPPQRTPVPPPTAPLPPPPPLEADWGLGHGAVPWALSAALGAVVGALAGVWRQRQRRAAPRLAAGVMSSEWADLEQDQKTCKRLAKAQQQLAIAEERLQKVRVRRPMPRGGGGVCPAALALPPPPRRQAMMLTLLTALRIRALSQWRSLPALNFRFLESTRGSDHNCNHPTLQLRQHALYEPAQPQLLRARGVRAQ